jgi:ABC-type branched-subunit amino acid transport system substrate-binding protein
MCLASYGADIGAMLPGIEQYKMLTLDGGGGTGTAFQKKPYFYGTRAITPDDTFPGVYQYVTQKMPDKKKVLYVIWDLGDAVLKPSEDKLKAELAKHNMEYLGLETAPIGTNDFSTLLARLKQKNADILHLGLYGLDPGFFMKQFDTSGINAQIIGSEFTPDAAKVAGAATTSTRSPTTSSTSIRRRTPGASSSSIPSRRSTPTQRRTSTQRTSTRTRSRSGTSSAALSPRTATPRTGIS